MISPEMQMAMDALKIRDVYLREQHSSCAEKIFPNVSDIDWKKFEFQRAHSVRNSSTDKLKDGTMLLRVYIGFGARWVDPKKKGKKDFVKAYIEAVFVAEYEMTAELIKASIDEFSRYNASFHVWPYWRELLSSQCTRMNLPKVLMPTMQFAGNRDVDDKPKARRSKSK